MPGQTYRSHLSSNSGGAPQRLPSSTVSEMAATASKLFGNTRDEYINVPRTILSAYAIGWDNLLKLLNEGRVWEFAGDASPSSPAPAPPAEPQARSPQPKPSISKPTIPDWVIKSGLGIAVVAAFVFMLLSYSWSLETSTLDDKQALSSTHDLDNTYHPPPEDGKSRSVMPQPSNVNPEQHGVRGYNRMDGAYIAPHIATNPDHDRTNNFSSPGNVNPYTGARGRK